MKKLKQVVYILVLASSTVSAQDVKLTQYLAAPLLLNPAMTGFVPQDFRFAGNYRQQWSSVSPNPYATGALSFDAAMLKNRLPTGDALGIGVVGMSDRSGSGGVINNTGGLSLAYHKTLGNDMSRHLSIGVQALWVNKEINYSKLTFEDMLNNGNGTLAYPLSTFPESGNISYLDYNVGIMYSERLGDRGMGYLGYSYSHLTEPVERFLFFDSNVIRPSHKAYLGGSYYITWNTILYGSALYREQAGAQELVLGLSAGFVLNPGQKNPRKKTGLYVGGWYRYQDAVAPYLSIEHSGLRLGVSYDINVSSFTPATSSVGAYEVSLIFTGGTYRGGVPKSWYAPKLY